MVTTGLQLGILGCPVRLVCPSTSSITWDLVRDSGAGLLTPIKPEDPGLEL